MNNPSRLLMLILCFLLLVATGTQAKSGFGAEVSYTSSYESNVFHSYADSLESADMVNILQAELYWKSKFSRAFRHFVLLYSDFDIYTTKSARNRLGYGLQYEPSYRYSHYGQFRIGADISRSKRDLIDDAGDVQTRILEKNVLKLDFRHSYRFGEIYTTQKVEYRNYNYDESYSGAVRLTSYDYHSLIFDLDAKYAFTKNFKIRFGFDTEKRNYDERKSYSLDKLYSEIRNFRQNSFDLDIYITPIDWIDLDFGGEFSRRKENFENFYGNDIWKWKIDAELKPFMRHLTKITFIYRTKDYDNYYTTHIGIANRVWIQYALFELEHFYDINYYLKLGFYLTTYNKISNDIDFDYQNSQAGIGFILNY